MLLNIMPEKKQIQKQKLMKLKKTRVFKNDKKSINDIFLKLLSKNKTTNYFLEIQKEG